ncbi:hypothetical protein Avbf_05142 [Armadillidium vulgare]|nr:hypothetical protein Avbf_05142 [Armadillidium vulgare]
MNVGERNWTVVDDDDMKQDVIRTALPSHFENLRMFSRR